MSRQKFPVRFFLGSACVAIFTSAFFAQKPDRQPSSDPSTKVRKATTEVNDVYKRWPIEDVPYILTEAERKAYEKLKTNDERENFIKIFWDNRDPTPDTEENEYREQYYERIAYANEHFSSGIPGWKTDRGRIYITWGKPDSVEANPSGGSYEKPSYEGGGSATTFPFETWFYRHLDGVGDGIEVQFVDPSGSGEYHIARDFNEKYVTTGPPQPVDTNASYLREQDMPFIVMERNVHLFSAPEVKFTDGAPVNTDTVINNNAIDTDMQIGFFRQSEGRVITTFTLQTSNKDLTFETVGGLGTARMNVIGKITSVAGRRVETFEDSVAANATTDDLLNIKKQKSIYQRIAALPPGTYKIDLTVRDVVSGNRSFSSVGFVVPRYDNKTLSVSTLVLASTLRTADSRDYGNRFVVGNAKLVPNLSGTYKQGQQVGVYMQVYNADVDQTTLRPSVDVEYVISKAGAVISNINEDWSGLSDSGQRITLARLLPTEKLEPGDYDVKIVIKDRVTDGKNNSGPTTIESSAKFTIEK